jgi:hypothetical protein
VQDTECTAWILRALGAKVGKRLHVHRGVDLARGGWDLLEIGDDVTLAQDAALRLVELEAGEIVVAPVALGSGATVDVRAGVSGGASLGPEACLAPLVAARGDACRPEKALGRRARHARRLRTSDAGARRCELARALHALLVIGMRALAGALRWLAAVLLARSGRGIDAARVQTWIHAPSIDPSVLTVVLVAACLSVPASLLFEGLLAVSAVCDRVIALDFAYLRVGLKTDIARFAGVWLSGTLMWPVGCSWLAEAWAASRNQHADRHRARARVDRNGPSRRGIYLGGPRLQRGA